MIIGTAGHIDHGKSTLIQALTGRAMDRLAEERRRGITIDLNFAPLVLADGTVAGVVDVPGHEDLIRTMVAGAAGIDLALLVIAADEGIMPQTREHLAIIEQLGIAQGIAVLTKCDLADPEWLELVQDEVSSWLQASPVAFGRPLPVSSTAGTGLEALRQELTRRLRGAVQRPADDLFRLPVDRAFSLAGVGTVLTGTIWSGEVTLGDTLRLLPGGHEARVRSIESHGQQLQRSTAGSRTAVGLAGLERSKVSRGDVLVHAAAPWRPTSMLDVEIGLLPSAPRPLTSRSRVRVHLAAGEVMARVQIPKAIDPGHAGVARLVLEAPLVARGGDRFVVRSYSPVITIGGGEVLDPLPPAARFQKDSALSSGDCPARLRALVGRRRNGLPQDQIALVLGIPPHQVGPLVDATAGLARAGGVVVLSSWLAEAAQSARGLVAAHHRAHPTDPGLPLETLRQQLGQGAEVATSVIDRLVTSGELVQADGVVRARGFDPRQHGAEAHLDLVVGALTQAALQPPSVKELEAHLGVGGLGTALRAAAKAGLLVAVEPDRYYASAALATFNATLRSIGAGGPITPQEVRERLGLSRKFLIPLLEWADRQGTTRRVGESRVLVPSPTLPST